MVAELSLLGVGYLSGNEIISVDPPELMAQFIADLERQPSSRVRTATIALLLSHPDYAIFVPAAVTQLRSNNRLLLKCFYTAAVYLQQEHAQVLQEMQNNTFIWLPDIYSEDLGVPRKTTLADRLVALGQRQYELTGVFANWPGTYENVVHHFLRYSELVKLWNQS